MLMPNLNPMEFNGQTFIEVGDNAMALPISLETFNNAMSLYNAGAMIQNAFHMLNADQREFMITGMTPEMWQEMMGDECQEEGNNGDPLPKEINEDQFDR